MTVYATAVSASEYDARETASANTLTDVSIVLSAGAHWGGAYFAAVVGYPPRYCTINSATFEIYINSTSNDNVYCDVYLEKSAVTPLAFTTTLGDISGRTKTAAKTSVAASNVGAGWYSFNIATPLQELVNDANYGGDIVALIDALASVDLTYRAWDYSDHSLAPKLTVDYTVAVASLVLPRRPRTYIRM